MSGLPNAETVPEALRNLPCWVAYRATPSTTKEGRIEKVPVSPHTGANASSTNPSNWSTLAHALERAKSDGLAGVGFVFSKENGIIGVDLDHCRDRDTGAIEPWAAEIVADLYSYTELSPSGTGVHVLLKGALPPGRRKKGPIEMYESGRFFTFTGQRLPSAPAAIEEREQELRALHARTFGEPAPAAEEAQADSSVHLDDDTLIQKARTSKHGAKFSALWNGDFRAYKSQSEADLALCGILAFWTGGDAAHVDRLFRRSGLMRPKWNQQTGDRSYGQRTIEKALSGKSVFYRPVRLYSSGQEFFRLTDTGNAERFVQSTKGNVRYCHPWKQWLVWNKKRWKIDDSGAVARLGKKTVRDIYLEARRARDASLVEAIADWAHRSEKVDRRKAMLELGKSEEGIPILPETLDRDPWLLNCANGTLDLRTLQCRAHAREDYLTKLTPTNYDPKAACPDWLRFLERVLPDTEVRAFLQHLIGWSITGAQRDQYVVFLVGEGANGKSTFLRVLLDVFGKGYAIQAAPEILLQRRDRGHPTELADLFGVRLAVCTEVGEGRVLDEPLVKRLTGGDIIRARRMREDFWEFEPTHHLWVASNHRPIIHGTDHAIWRRIIVIPFGVKIPKQEQDPALVEKLLKERAGILSWAVAGCQAWQRAGRLNPPQKVQLAVDDYRREMDVLGQFIEERCQLAELAKVGATKLYQAFRSWSEERGEPEISQTAFGTRLRARGIVSAKSGVAIYRGICLRPHGEKRATWEGSGPSAGSSLTRARVESNRQTVPNPPYEEGAPTNGAVSTDARHAPAAGPPGRCCRDCEGSDWWQNEAGGPWRCRVCNPPEQGSAAELYDAGPVEAHDA